MVVLQMFQVRGMGGLGCGRRAWHWLCADGQQPVLLHPFAFGGNFGKLCMIVIGVVMFSGGSAGIAGKGHGWCGWDGVAWCLLHQFNAQQPMLFQLLNLCIEFGKMDFVIVGIVGCQR